MIFITYDLNELCGAMDKPFDFEFWGRRFDPNSRKLFCFVLDSISFLYEIGAICINR